MLVRFALDPDAVAGGEYNLDDVKKHRSMISLWERVGVLVIPGEKERESLLLRRLSEAPQGVQVLWRNALKHHRKQCGALSLEKIMGSLDPAQDNECCGEIQVASLESTRAELWGLKESDFSRIFNGELEICRFGHEDETHSFKNALSSIVRPISPGETPGQVWSQRFKDLVMTSKVITIVDRYAVKEHFACAADRVISGLQRFLIRAADSSAPSKKIIHIYASCSLDWHPFSQHERFEDACAMIFSEIEALCLTLSDSALLEVNVHIVADKKFGSINHYRYVKFDDKSVLLLDTGLEPLGGDRVFRTCGVQFASWLSEDSKIYRDDAQRLRSFVEADKRINCVDTGIR